MAELTQLAAPMLQRLVKAGKRDLARLVLARLCGLRNLDKTPLQPHQLTPRHARVYQKLLEYLALPGRKTRLLGFLRKPQWSLRTLEYFVVQFTHHHPVDYWLQRGVYPPVVYETQHCQLKPGAAWIRINLHTAYMNASSQGCNRGLLAPYGRGVTVQHEGEVYPLSTLNFLVWFDQLGGPEILARKLEQVLREKKTHSLHSSLHQKRRLEKIQNGERACKKPKLTAAACHEANLATRVQAWDPLACGSLPSSERLTELPDWV